MNYGRNAFFAAPQRPNKPPAEITKLGPLDISGDGVAACEAVRAAFAQAGYLGASPEEDSRFRAMGWIVPINQQAFDLRYDPKNREIMLGVACDPRRLGLRMRSEAFVVADDETDIHSYPDEPEKAVPRIAAVLGKLGLAPFQIRWASGGESSVGYDARFPIDPPKKIVVTAAYEFTNERDAANFLAHLDSQHTQKDFNAVSRSVSRKDSPK